MHNLWNVTRQTFIQCVRTRILVGFMILLAVCVLAIGLTVQGDGSLAGRVRTFLAYGVSLTQILLAIVTVFLSAGIIAADVRQKTIFTVAVKPVRRWQYVLGRWLGVVCVNAVLLGLALGSIYGVSQYLRCRPTQLERFQALGKAPADLVDPDRLAIDSEVFTARRRHRPEPIDVDAAVQSAYDKLVERIGLDELIRGRIRQWLQAESRNEFVDEEQVERLLGDRSMREDMIASIKLRLQAEKLDQRLLVMPGTLGPRITFRNVRPPKGAEETIRLRYRLRPTGAVSSDQLQSRWLFLLPGAPPISPHPRTDSTKAPSSFTIPPEVSKAIHQAGELSVQYYNEDNPSPVKLRLDDFALLYRVGSFEGNLLRAGALMLLRLMFLAAVGILFGSFLSFPVACIAWMIIFCLGLMGGFVQEATAVDANVGDGVSVYQYFSHYLAKGVYFVLPSFAGVSPVDSLVNGLAIAERDVGREFLGVVSAASPGSAWLWRTVGFEIETGTGLRTWLFLAAACLIFRRRELARVQV